jgi:hypothetical protein
MSAVLLWSVVWSVQANGISSKANVRPLQAFAVVYVYTQPEPPTPYVVFLVPTPVLEGTSPHLTVRLYNILIGRCATPPLPRPLFVSPATLSSSASAAAKVAALSIPGSDIRDSAV